MSPDQSVQRDERTVAVENASYKWACIFVIFALLIDVVYRGTIRNEAAWDLLALAIAPGIICMIYQARHQIWGRRWVRDAALIVCLGGVIGFVVAVILTMIRAM
jgi:hypothetical protein